MLNMISRAGAESSVEIPGDVGYIDVLNITRVLGHIWLIT